MAKVAYVWNVLFKTLIGAREGKSLGNSRENKIGPHKFDALRWIIHSFKKQAKVNFHASCPALKQEGTVSQFSWAAQSVGDNIQVLFSQ